jgi:dipeptidyl aminopeptidase/acylaminoacyl peptidase
MPEAVKTNTEAAKLRPFAQDDNFRSKHVTDAVMAADGTVFYQVVETVGEAAKDTERQRMTIWRLDPHSGERGEITTWAANAMSPAISADGNSVYFLASPDKAAPPQIHRLSVKTGALAALTSMETGVTMFAVSPDDKTVALAAVDPDAKNRKAKGHIRISALNYRFDSLPGYLQDSPQALHVVPVDGNEKPKPISPFDGLVTAIRWSPDGKRLAYTVNGESKSLKFAMAGNLYVTDVIGDRRLVLDTRVLTAPEWTADGRGILFFGPFDGLLAKEWHLCRVDVDSGTVTSRTEALDRSANALFQVNSGSVLVAARMLVAGTSAIATIGVGGRGTLCRIALEGKEQVETLVSGDFIARPLALSGRQLLYSRQDVHRPSELWLRDLDSGKDCALTDHNATWQAGIAWPTLDAVSVKSDGVTIEGWVLRPADAKGPCPAVLYIHGGPHAAFGYGYCEDFHELVGAGYAVVFANPRGSTNYGSAFSTAIIERWGHPEYADFMALLDHLVDRKLIDGDRLAVTGVSGGGHLSAWLMTHTDRFKAAVPEQGVYSMISMYGVSDAGPELIALEMGGHPHEQPERYWALSPVAHAHKCKTPTLLIQGENDIRCPMEQAEQLYAVLKINGCEAELLRLENCKHGHELVVSPSLRRIRMDAMKDWFERHVTQA